MAQTTRAMVALLAQSQAGLDVLAHAEEMLDRFGIAWASSIVRAGDEERIVPELETGGIAVLIVANTARQPLSTTVARLTIRPVLAVPVATDDLPALESLQSSAAPGAAAGTLAIGKPGAINAALLAVAILANGDARLREKLDGFRRDQTQRVLEDRLDS